MWVSQPSDGHTRFVSLLSLGPFFLERLLYGPAVEIVRLDRTPSRTAHFDDDDDDADDVPTVFDSDQCSLRTRTGGDTKGPKRD